MHMLLHSPSACPKVPGRGLSARTAPVPDCRRPWCTWADTSSWEDQAFFMRSGL